MTDTMTLGAQSAATAPSPSATIVAAAIQTGSCTGPSGCSYQFKRLRPLDRMLIAKAVGAELMVNPVYAAYAVVACSITSIAGQPQAMPGTARQVEALVQRIGEDWDHLNLAMGLAFAPVEPEGSEGDAEG